MGSGSWVRVRGVRGRRVRLRCLRSVTAFPARSWKRLAMWWASTSRLHPYWAAWPAYHNRRSADSLSMILFAPALLVLPGQDVGADRPVRRQQLTVGRRDRPLLTFGDPGGHRRQQRRVPAGQCRGPGGTGNCAPAPGAAPRAGRPSPTGRTSVFSVRRPRAAGPVSGHGPRDEPPVGDHPAGRARHRRRTRLPAARVSPGAARRPPGTDVSGEPGDVSGEPVMSAAGGDNCS